METFFEFIGGLLQLAVRLVITGIIIALAVAFPMAAIIVLLFLIAIK